MKSVAEPKQTFCIPYLQATMFACALEDSITQLRILDEFNTELRLLNTMANIKALRANKYQVEVTQTEDPLTTINKKQLGGTQYKLDKLFSDRKYCTDVVQKTYLEMALSKSYSALTAYNKEVEDVNVYRDNLINEEGRNRITRRELTRHLRQQRNHMKSIIYDTDSIVDHLTDTVKDTTLNTEVKGRYLDKWQLARSEQHQQVILNKEAELSDSLDFYQNRSDEEQRVHAEVELLFNIHINGIDLRQTLSSISEEVIENVQISVSEPEPTDKSSYLLSSLFATVLEDVLMQMWILDNCNNELLLIKTLSDINHLKAIKYNVRDSNKIKDELDGIDSHNLNCLIYKVKKLEADRKYVNNTMVATYLALAQSFSFHPLVSFINSVEERERFLIQIAEEESKNRILLKDLSKQVRQQHNHYKTLMYDTEVIIDKLRTRVEDSVLYAELRGRYIDNWQRARTEQHNKSIFDIENGPTLSIKCYKEKTEHELRVHTEVETLITIAINETLSKIEDWMNKFDTDMEKIDLQIQIKKNDYQNMRDKRMNLEETLARHETKMKNWIQFKEEREKERAYREKMQTSAIVVQAWWRGLLVRRQLGPYRPKKTKKGKKY